MTQLIGAVAIWLVKKFDLRRIQTSRNRQSSTFSSAPSPRRILVLEITQVTPNNINIPQLRKSFVKSQTQSKSSRTSSRVTTKPPRSFRTLNSNGVKTREKPPRTRQSSRSKKRTSQIMKPQTATTTAVRRRPTTTTKSKTSRC